MYSSPEEIEAAVDAYRSYIASYNRRILEVIVPFVAAAEYEEDSDDEGIEEDINEVRVSSLTDLLSHRIAPFVSSPNDVLTRFDELVPVQGLDGIGIHEPGLFTDPDYVLRRDRYFSLLEQALREKCLPEVRATITVPEEFRYLAEHVRVLTGQDLGVGTKSRQAVFWLGIMDDAESVAELIMTPEEMSYLNGWECAAGWRPGGGFECPFYVVFCRRCASVEPGSEPEPWAWRYVMSSMDILTTAFDTIPEFLEMYCQFRLDRIPDVADLNVDDVLGSMWVNYGFI